MTNPVYILKRRAESVGAGGCALWKPNKATFKLKPLTNWLLLYTVAAEQLSLTS